MQPRPSAAPPVRKHASLTAMARGLEGVQNPFFLQNSTGRAICLADSSPAPSPASRWVFPAAGERHEPASSQLPKAAAETREG